jgi:hypothetical protein
MNTHDFFHSVLDPRYFKNAATLTEYESLKNYTLVKATTLYDIYRHMVFGSDARLTMKDFFRVCAQYLYYDKYICDHGTEFYYYIGFQEHEIVTLMRPIIDKRIISNAPDTLKDIQYTVKPFERKL